MRPRIYKLAKTPAPWGDYGAILRHGMITGKFVEGAPLELERTGPFVPPLSMPGGDLIVTAAMRKKLQDSGLKGLRFVRVVKKRIVNLRWEKWDPKDELPRRPLGGEPENYILIGKHNPEVSAEMGNLFEVRPRQRVPYVVQGTEFRWGTEWPRLLPDYGPWRGGDFFRGERGSYVYVTARAKTWLARHARKWVSFEPAHWAEG